MNNTDVPRVVLQPGDFHFGAAPLQLATLLGSCVTVTLWHPRRHIGGMCHFIAPRRPHRGHQTPDGHFADEAFAMFDQAIARSSCRPQEFQAKLFGGGNMFPDARSNLSVGKLNIAAARDMIRQRAIPLVGVHVGGAGHRKLVFDLANGEVRLFFANLSPEEESAHA